LAGGFQAVCYGWRGNGFKLLGVELPEGEKFKMEIRDNDYKVGSQNHGKCLSSQQNSKSESLHKKSNKVSQTFLTTLKVRSEGIAKIIFLKF
jgi:predicted DNA-binding antitoxin AbrB/MazE fold protein